MSSFPFENILKNKKLNLNFNFNNFKIKYSISHKSTRNSTYITEIKIDNKKFPLIKNIGKFPIIPNNTYFFKNEFSIDDLENTYLLISVYEFLEDLSEFSNTSLLDIPEEYKEKYQYNSIFRINLISFLFRPVQCDFQ